MKKSFMANLSLLIRSFLMISVFSVAAFMAAAWVASMIGCGRGGTSGSEMPAVNPSAAAEKAIELFDKDGNGSLDESELVACPGILAARDRYDTDGNRVISQDEIAARLAAVFNTGTAWLTVNCQVFQGGSPLAGANVRFVPEPFLEDALQPAVGTTDGQGTANPAVVDEVLPDDMKGLHIMHPGVYRVEITHPRIKAPHKPLGYEIDSVARGGTDPVFRL